MLSSVLNIASTFADLKTSVVALIIIIIIKLSSHRTK